MLNLPYSKVPWSTKRWSRIDTPLPHCDLCPRLAAFRLDNQQKFCDWHNAPVDSFGSFTAELLIVGLAPGLRGANRTGRPFTGDYAGDLLYAALRRFNLSNGQYKAHPNDGLSLINCRITNAVRCVPPKNLPTTTEIKTCMNFLSSEIKSMYKLRAIIALGRVAHDAILNAYKQNKAQYRFGHGQRHPITSKILLFDSYHCSRYNTNTGRLTPRMFYNVFRAVTRYLKESQS